MQIGHRNVLDDAVRRSDDRCPLGRADKQMVGIEFIAYMRLRTVKNVCSDRFAGDYPLPLIDFCCRSECKRQHTYQT